MPTEPLTSVLYRELMIAQAKPYIDLASPLLKELVDYSSNALIRCATSVRGEPNEDLAAMALYRHIIELTDAMEVLVSHSCGAAAIPLARSSFEALVSIDYIVEDPSRYTLRSLSWLAGYVRRKLKFYRSLDPASSSGQRFLEATEHDKMVRDFPLPPVGKVQPGIENLENLLARDQFRPIQDEYARHDRDPHWYSLFDGPSNLRELSEHVKRNAQYEVLYWQWSLATHAQDFSPFIAATSEGEMGIRGIRDPGELPDIAVFSSNFILDATRLMLARFRPGETWGRWYMKEVRDRYLRICRRE